MRIQLIIMSFRDCSKGHKGASSKTVSRKMLNVQNPEIPRWCVELAWLIYVSKLYFEGKFVGFSSPKPHKTRHPKCSKCTGAGWGTPPLVGLRRSILPDRGIDPVPGRCWLLLAEIYRSVWPKGVIVGGLPKMTDF